VKRKEDDLLKQSLRGIQDRSALWSASADRPASRHDRHDRSARAAALQMLSRLRQYPIRRRSRPDQIAHRFIRGVGDPDRCQLAGAVQLGQDQRITAIRLHPIARFDRDQRRRHHHALMAPAGQQPMQAITTRAGFVAEAQVTTPFGQPRRQFRQNFRTVVKNPDLADLTARGRLRQARRRSSPPAFARAGLCTSNRRAHRRGALRLARPRQRGHRMAAAGRHPSDAKRIRPSRHAAWSWGIRGCQLVRAPLMGAGQGGGDLAEGSSVPGLHD
jgi:hypothetical protein